MEATLAALLLDESGASMVEYGFIIALIAMAAITAVRMFGTSTNALFSAAAAVVSKTSTSR